MSPAMPRRAASWSAWAVRDRFLGLTIEDNGRGIDSSRLDDLHSLGLLGMRERALLLGGEFEIAGKPGLGTTVHVRIPLTDDEEKP